MMGSWVINLVLISDPCETGTLYGFERVHFFFFFFFLPRACPHHVSGTVTHRDSKLSVLLGPAVPFCTIAYHAIRFVNFFINQYY